MRGAGGARCGAKPGEAEPPTSDAADVLMQAEAALYALQETMRQSPLKRRESTRPTPCSPPSRHHGNTNPGNAHERISVQRA
jgi:hypothetical protein